MAKILWIASYPKSGNTWIRFLIASLFSGSIERSIEVEHLIPDIHVGINDTHLRDDRRTFVKTHWMHHPRLPLREDTIGAIYIMRNPLQVMVSSYHYSFRVSREAMGLQTDASEQAYRDNFFRSFAESGNVVDWLKRGFGRWDENVRSWTSGDLAYPVHVIRYEDLSADPRGVVGRLCRFIGATKSKADIDAAIAASSFDALRAMEERETSNNLERLQTI